MSGFGYTHRMKSVGKLAWFSLLGFLAALPIYWLFLWMLVSVRSAFGGTADSYMLASFAVMMPIAFFLGSSLTGYLSRPLLRTGVGYIGVSPGLYPCLIMITVNVVMTYVVEDSSPLPFPENVYLLGVFVSWFLFSWAGVRVGAFMRSGKTQESA